MKLRLRFPLRFPLRFFVRLPMSLILLGGALAGCAGLPPTRGGDLPPPAAAVVTASAWQAPPPQAGAITDLAAWWSRFDDPMLLPLIESAQQASPSLASAAARIAQARAARAAAGAALGPQVNAAVVATHGRADPAAQVATSASAGVQAAWEIDLFGGGAATRNAAQARLAGAQAQWADTQIAVAAETAAAYTALRACEAQLAQSQIDAASRAETSRISELSARAGLLAPASAALTRASAAQGRSLVTSQRASCDTLVKGLVALTAIGESALRSRLAPRTAQLPQSAPIVPALLPAALLAQRPDIFGAAQAVVAAAADQRATDVQRLPRLSLAGSIGLLGVSTSRGSSEGSTWSLGPLQVTFPIFDGGTRAANSSAARAAYDEAVALYQARVRQAVREVEETLVVLQDTAARSDDATVAAVGFEASFRAAEERFKGGLGSSFELEDARRSAVAAAAALIELQRQRATAWITLYRVLGGGWNDKTLPSDKS